MEPSRRKAVFLDRDGVLNAVVMTDSRPHSPRRFQEFSILAGVRDSLDDLRAAGFLLIVATNQPEIARGLLDSRELTLMHEYMMSTLPLDDIRVCLHDDGDGCICRKPHPGLITEAARDWNIDTGQSYMIGDRDKDVEAGQRAGCKTILIRRSYNVGCRPQPERCVKSILEAAQYILTSSHSGSLV